MRVFLGAHNIISPLGFSSEENFTALLEGKSAVQKRSFDFSDKPICCSVVEKAQLDKQFKTLADPKQFTHLEKMCILSIQDVLNQSQVDPSKEDTLLIVSTTKGNVDILEKAYPSFPDQRAYLPELGKVLADFFKFKNTPLIVSNACISGLLAIVIAKRLIENNTYKNVIVCGGDIVSEFTLSGFKSFNAMSDSVCRPFDKDRTGINLGEAAASILLSTEAVSKIIISAGASANDANHISGPSRTGDGLYQAITETLKDVKTVPDLISAHGTATEYNDEMESMAFSRAGLTQVPLNSLKAYYGHTLGTAGVLESIISLLSLEKSKVLRSLGFESVGTTQALNVITQTENKELKSCMKTASGFGGCNAVAVFEKI